METSYAIHPLEVLLELWSCRAQSSNKRRQLLPVKDPAQKVDLGLTLAIQEFHFKNALLLHVQATCERRTKKIRHTSLTLLEVDD